jgi:hypothetical protein
MMPLKVQLCVVADPLGLANVKMFPPPGIEVLLDSVRVVLPVKSIPALNVSADTPVEIVSKSDHPALFTFFCITKLATPLFTEVTGREMTPTFDDWEALAVPDQPWPSSTRRGELCCKDTVAGVLFSKTNWSGEVVPWPLL